MKKMNKLSKADKYYIAGFLDGDGCINAQIVKRPDYKLKFQIRVYISFYQKTKHHWFLLWLQEKCKYGLIRKRNDGMSEYTITGIDSVYNILKELEPMVRIKKPQLKLVLQIIKELPKAKDPQTFLTLCESVDRFEQLNYSKKREIKSETVRSILVN
tara:strand:- start:1770 stop:2240 length:471 start_codon:yes stop_codon:yes gene_type:complete